MYMHLFYDASGMIKMFILVDVSDIFLAELRRPEGPPSGAPYLSCERKGNP